MRVARLRLADPIAPPTRVNSWLLFVVALWSAALFIVWLWARTAPYGVAAYAILVGWLTVPEVPAAVRNIRNVLALFGVIRGGRGDAREPGPSAERVGLKDVSFELLVSALICILLWVALRDWFLIGGAAGCFLEAGQA